MGTHNGLYALKTQLKQTYPSPALMERQTTNPRQVIEKTLGVRYACRVLQQDDIMESAPMPTSDGLSWTLNI